MNIVGGINMINKKRKNKMEELYQLKKAYSSTRQKNYAKMSDALTVKNDRLNTLVLTFGVIICSIFISIITR